LTNPTQGAQERRTYPDFAGKGAMVTGRPRSIGATVDVPRVKVMLTSVDELTPERRWGAQRVGDELLCRCGYVPRCPRRTP
jgi:hypothetical protein